jgi:hypothetical protein
MSKIASRDARTQAYHAGRSTLLLPAKLYREKVPMHGGEFDPSTLASQALPLLVTYLRHVGGRLVDRAADDLDDMVLRKLTALYERVKAKVTGESFAGQALERLEQEPENTRRQGAFEDALAEVVTGDPSFAAVLAGLLEEARRTAGPTLTRIDQSGATSIHGDVTLEGTNVAGRDLHVGEQRLRGGDPRARDLRAGTGHAHLPRDPCRGRRSTA